MGDERRRIFRFGVFEVDAASGELRKSGVRLRLQDQPFQILLLLLERADTIVTREELRQKLWPADTFVDFDHSLNTIINKLREVLGDSASNPRFVETVAKRGYRFLAAVEMVTDRNGQAAVLATDPPDSTAPRASTTSLLTSSEDLPAVPRGHVRLLFVLIQVMYLSFYIVALARLGVVEELLEHTFGRPAWIITVMVASAAVGIPVRLYLLSAVGFEAAGLGRKFLRLFPGIFVLDQLWALSPFLLAPQIGMGLALAATAALIYLPFSQRTLLLMRERRAG